jgi:hypothetical protein
MKSYKDPPFQERIGRAAEAKQKALDQLRSKPPLDEKAVADRRAARLRREEAEAGKRAARKADEQPSKEANVADTTGVAAAPPPPTDEERKRARDARYAARKSRK